jgi:hypothetical protein
MAVTKPGAKFTVDLGDRQLYQELLAASAEEDMTVREIIIEAVRYWLDHREEVEDTLAAEKIAAVDEASTGERLDFRKALEQMRNS